jgi:hypothetical protein
LPCAASATRSALDCSSTMSASSVPMTIRNGGLPGAAWVIGDAFE